MEFKNLSLRSMLLLGAAGVMLAFTLIGKLAHGSMPAPSPGALTSQALAMEPAQPPPAGFHPSQPMQEAMEEDLPSIKEMKEQMEADRLQQKKIKMLKLQLEQVNLQLAQEKALSEIGQLKKENTSIVDDATQGLDKYPDIKVLYIGGTEEKKEAILSINGINYSVKPKNKPVKNVEIISISDSSVMVHFDLPQEKTSTIDYKPE